MKKTLLIGVIAAAVVLAAALWLGWLEWGSAPAPQPAAPQAALSPAAPQAERPATSEEPPSFDVVRVEEGHAVIAGRAAPGADVSVLDGSKTIGEVKANSRGEWVLMPEAESSARQS